MLALLATVAALAAPVTTPATNVTSSSATLNGTDDTNATTTFHYGTSTAKTLTAGPVTVSGGQAHADVSGLSANTTYHFAIDGGQDLTFKTLPNPTPPGIADQHAVPVHPGQEHVSATLAANGAATTYYFQYGRSTSYGNRSAQLTVPADSVGTVQAELTDLRPYTRYHWRLFARNDAGNTAGRDHTFRTGRVATAITVFSTRKTVQWGRGVTLGGRVSGYGANQMTLALEQERFPFGTGFQEIRTTHAGSDGGYLFSIDNVWGLTRFRVVTRTQTPLTSTELPVKVAPRTTIGTRNLSRKRARVAGTLRPATTGELSLQRRLATGKWAQVKHRAIAGAKSFSFKVFRARKVNRAYRVVVLPVKGAYVKTKTRSVIVSRRPARARGHRAAAG
jgi:hypothetical protein